MLLTDQLDVSLFNAIYNKYLEMDHKNKNVKDKIMKLLEQKRKRSLWSLVRPR